MNAVPSTFSLRVNGVERQVEDTRPGESLLFVLRERLGLPGSKNACEQGECGSCSVLVDGELVCACLELAAAVAGCDVVTVEGLARRAPGAAGPTGDAPANGSDDGVHRDEHDDHDDLGDTLTDVQRAMVEAGGVQCGFCTPGFVVAIDRLLEREPAPTPVQVREALAGNLCRCTGYGRIVAAIEAVVRGRSEGAPP
ncbi:MAG TPA: (2Fe-2S)-binding protein [Acidimicrobiales bacterium]